MNSPGGIEGLLLGAFFGGGEIGAIDGYLNTGALLGALLGGEGLYVLALRGGLYEGGLSEGSEGSMCDGGLLGALVGFDGGRYVVGLNTLGGALLGGGDSGLASGDTPPP